MAHSVIYCARKCLLLLLCLITPIAAVTVFPSDAAPRSYRTQVAIATDPQKLFTESCPEEFATYPNASVLFSSTSGLLTTKAIPVYPSSDSFVRGTIDAWAQHQHLVIRPEEVWFSILVQMNFYMSKNSEVLRKMFVDHEGQQEILVEDYTWEKVLGQFKFEIQKRVKTDWLLEWILPSFTTTTETDIMTANVLMMGLMKAYFKYVGDIVCGLPSVTLLGEKEDWEKLLAKLDRLKDFGVEPTQYGDQLRPILSRFVQTFDKPDDPDIRKFWNNIIHANPSRTCGLPPYYLTGWLMGFYFWDIKGDALYRSQAEAYSLDGIVYTRRGIDHLPVGYAQAPFLMKEFPDERTPEFEAYVLAGNIGKQIIPGVPDGYAKALQRFNGSVVDVSAPHSMLKPLSGWMIYGPGSHKTPVKHTDEKSRETVLLSRALDSCGAGTGAFSGTSMVN